MAIRDIFSFGGKPVLSQTQSPARRLTLLGTTNATVVARGSAPAKTPTTTKPVTSGGSIVFNTEGMTYLRLFLFFQSTGGTVPNTPAVRVIGWEQAEDSSGLWVPGTLFDGSCVRNATASTVNAVATMQQVAQFTKIYGDAKMYQAGSTAPIGGGFLFMDHCAFPLMEVEFGATSLTGTPVANGYVSTH